VVFLLALTGVATSAYANQSVSFRLNWILAGEGDLAPFFVAKSKGYYQQQGLDVSIQQGSGSGAAAKFVSVGRADIGIADFPTIALAIARGADLKIIGSYQVNSPDAVWTRKDAGITSPKDLPGHTIGAPASDAQRIAWPAFAQAVGIPVGSVQWVSISPAAKITSLASGRVDATVHFMDQRCLYQNAVGANNLEFFRWANHGVNPYGNMIFTTTKMIKEHPNELREFLQATYHGLRDSIVDPHGAIEIAQQYQSSVNVKKVLSMLLISIKYMLYPGKGNSQRLGYISPSRMASSAKLVNTYFDIPHKLNAEQLYTNQFVPDWTWPKASDLSTPSTWPYPSGVNHPCRQ